MNDEHKNSKLFVSYTYCDGAYSGFGNLLITADYDMSSGESIAKLESLIAKAKKHSSVVILNFREVN